MVHTAPLSTKYLLTTHILSIDTKVERESQLYKPQQDVFVKSSIQHNDVDMTNCGMQQKKE
jgi:hypothetical protein